MTIEYAVQVGDAHPDLSQIQRIIDTTFREIDQIYNNWNPYSEVSLLNALPAWQKLELSPQLAVFLKKIERLNALTEGRFDPTVAPIKMSLLAGEITTHSPVGWEKIHLEGDIFWKEEGAIALDLGGVAKGYAVDLLVERLQNQGYDHLFVEWGGEIRVAGRHPEGRPWKVAILYPNSVVLELHEEAIATSGSYHQRWEIGEATYTHIIDPKTREPLSNSPIQSASVVTQSCMEADAFATALMLFASQEEAYAWAEKNNLRIWLF